MKKLLLSLAGFCLLASFTINTKQTAIKKDTAFECPECTKEFEKCSKPLHNAYADEVEKAADKFKAGNISREEYDTVCLEARTKMNKPQMDCITSYNKCCLKETREIMEKEEQNKKRKD